MTGSRGEPTGAEGGRAGRANLSCMAATQVSPHEPTRPLTDEEWIELDEDEPGELVDGVLVEEEMPDFVHEVVVAFFVRVIGVWLETRGGFVVGSDVKYLLRKGRGRKPDVSVYLPGGRKPARRGAVRVPPDIAIEVISPRPRDVRRDRIEKTDDYAAFGVRWYWIVDPEARALEIFQRNDDGRYVRVLSAAAGRVDDVPGCAGLGVDLDALWAKVDELPEGDESE